MIMSTSNHSIQSLFLIRKIDMKEVTHEDAMKWLKYMKGEYSLEEDDTGIIEYIQEVLWRDNDIRNS